MKHIVSRMSSYFPNRWPLSYLNLTKNMKTYIRRQKHKQIFIHQDIKQKEPPQKYRLGRISNTKLLAGLNRFSCIAANIRIYDVQNHSVYPSVCRTDGYGTDRRVQEHALFRAKNVLYSFSSKTVRFECIVISALHVHLLSSKTP